MQTKNHHQQLAEAFSQTRNSTTVRKPETVPCHRCSQPVPKPVDPFSAFLCKPTRAKAFCKSCSADLKRELAKWESAQKENREREVAQIEKRQRMKRFNEACPFDMRELDIARLPAKGRKHQRLVTEWKFSNGQGLVLTGETGTGKTRLSWALARHLIVDEGRDVLFVSATDLARAAAFMVHEPHTYRTLIRRTQTADVLFLDDLGVERATTRFQSDIADLICYRGDRRMPNVITSNYGAADLMKRFDDEMAAERFMRRLKEFHQVIVF